MHFSFGTGERRLKDYWRWETVFLDPSDSQEEVWSRGTTSDLTFRHVDIRKRP